MTQFKIEKLEKIKNFLSSLKDYSLVYHKDSDGVCSAALLTKILGEPKTVSPNDKPSIEITDQLIKTINKTPKTIFTDLPVDQLNYKKIKSDTLVIDHHTTKENLNKTKQKNFLHINPRFQKPDIYLPASYLVYKILKELGYGVEKYKWIAGIGIVGDRGTENCKDLIEEIEKDFDLNIEDLDFLSSLIESSKIVKGVSGVSEAFKIVSNAKNPNDILDSKLMNYYKKSQKEIENLMLDFEYNSEYVPNADAYLYKLVSRYNVGSVISTKLSEKNPDTAIFVYKITSYFFMSARCQSGRINVGKLLKKLTKGLGKGGGHPQAAGASMPKENGEEFLKRLRNYLEKI